VGAEKRQARGCATFLKIEPVAITMAQEKGDFMSLDYRDVLARFEGDVAAALDEAYRREGYVDEDDKPSDTPMKKAAFDVIMARCVVKSKAERSRKALTRGELYKLVFPSGPDDDADLDPVQNKVLSTLLTAVWGLTQTTRSGYVQRQFDVEGTTLVLCRCKVYRNADQMQAVYATDNESLIMEDAVDKEIQSLVRRASALRKDLNMIIERHPKLHQAVATQLGLELRKVDAELTSGMLSDASSRKKVA